MIAFALKYKDKLLQALVEHLELVFFALLISVVIASLLTILSLYSKKLTTFLINLAATLYSIPSLALLGILVPFTGLGKTTALIALVLYNQYILLQNFTSGIQNVDKSLIESAQGLGLTTLQIFTKIQLPLAKKSLIVGIRLGIISTVSIATIAATINAGGLGVILFDGLRAMNIYKILWGSILTAALSLTLNFLLTQVEERLS
ncbi:osmoprotectant transport system permease protein [Enterococcus sp. PF1-24]|uniref:ABC transporter permease n=1 Tax=unclassified Enterococcus TaxID=2608891 RepID=UPI00247339AA|nr:MULTISPECIES: ABC transporter permease [unclassified Enterococcus]MDH6364395.1 osmoprotectant transport system permease protein [Enterococcus sp. PFB1-1]MDH6401416.1 osmoprotectant transport system permease protein [Enterococcus sp. PF1-24]